MHLLTDDTFQKLKDEDLETLVHLDDHGLLIGPDETLDEFIKRLQTLKKRISELNELEDKLEIYDLSLKIDNRIPPDVFKECEDVNESLYKFKIDWVPGFYTNESMGLLFAGGAIYSYDDFFPVFIIREAYKEQKKWWIYPRKELMAHELTHIAHVGYEVDNFEELFAYQTSESAFRRIMGGVFRTTRDTYLLLGSVMFASLSQIINTLVRPPEEAWHFPMPQIFIFTGLVLVYLSITYGLTMGKFKKAKKRVAEYFSEDVAMAVLFRCDETEIAEIASIKAGTLEEWLKNKQKKSVRWRVTLKKFNRLQ